jgi:hypothetical protein
MTEEEFPSIGCALEFNYLSIIIKLCNINIKLFFSMAFITIIS